MEKLAESSVDFFNQTAKKINTENKFVYAKPFFFFFFKFSDALQK